MKTTAKGIIKYNMNGKIKKEYFVGNLEDLVNTVANRYEELKATGYEILVANVVG